jgi:membrane-bound ClpP family serine protease
MAVGVNSEASPEPRRIPALTPEGSPEPGAGIMKLAQPAEEALVWVIAGVLLGLVVLSSLVGFHSGPHAHVGAGVLGVLAATWLVIMAVDGRTAPVLWALLSADIVVSVGVGLMAWNGLSAQSTVGHHVRSVEGSEGVAVSDLVPEGIVRVRGEQWSAVSVNGTVPSGTPVQVIRAAGVRLEVWGEDSDVLRVDGAFSLDEGESKENRT